MYISLVDIIYVINEFSGCKILSAYNIIGLYFWCWCCI